jgi:phosphoglycerate dehydrogenase-like enzyme
MADWSPMAGRGEITVFDDHLFEDDAVVERLAPFDIVCVMRERTPLTRARIERLPRLRLICSTGPRNASIDLAAAKEHGVEVVHTGYSSTPTIEFTWALVMAMVRDIPIEIASVRAGGWQRTVGDELRGKTLGIVGLGNIGSAIARIAQAFGMETIAWSENMTAEKAAGCGARHAGKDELFREADLVTIHLVLSDRTRGIVGEREIGLMKKTARLVNTSRGPIVDEAALVRALREGRIAGAAVDVFEVEPLPSDHPFRTLDNVLATPHLGYVSKEMYRVFYGDTVKNIADRLDRYGPDRSFTAVE